MMFLSSVSMTLYLVDAVFIHHHLKPLRQELFQCHPSFSQLTLILMSCLKATEDNLKMAADDAATLTNGGGKGDVSEEATQSSFDSDALSSEHPDTKSKDRTDVPVSEDELNPISKLAMCEEEEAEGTLVIRAERVVVTEEGTKAHEDLVALPEQVQVRQLEEEAVTSSAKGGQVVAVTEVIKTDMSTQGDDNDDDDGRKHTVEKDLQDFSDTSTDSADKASDPTSLKVQPSPGDAEAAALSPVPVYGESTLNPELQLEAAAAEVLPEESETRDPIPAAGHFQDVPLAEPQQQQQAEEEEPLLSQATTPNICSEAEAAFSVTCSPTAHSPPRLGQGEDTQAPKHKSCQCCSVM